MLKRPINKPLNFLKNIFIKISQFPKLAFVLIKKLLLTIPRKTKNKKLNKKFDNSIWESIKTVAIAFLIAVVFRSFLFQPFYIPSSSMKPNLLIGDFVFVSKYTYGYSRYSFPFELPFFKGRTYGKKPERGDVIVFRLPSNPKINYIKRLVGLPGDTVQMKYGQLYINGKKMPKKYLSRYNGGILELGTKVYSETLPNGKEYSILDSKIDGEGDNTDKFIIPENQYFFLGDNRDNSMDSRFSNGSGLVPYENLVGKAQVIFLSSTENPLQFWKWPLIIRLKRMFKTVK